MTKKRRPTKDWLQATADTFCDALEGAITGGTYCPPWRAPWKGRRRMVGGVMVADHNPTSGTVYQGINVCLLLMSRSSQGFGSMEWGTFKQWKKHGGTVSLGSKGTSIVFWKPVIRPLTDEDGNPVLNSKGEPRTRKSFFLKGHTVFNRDQVEGLSESPPWDEAPFTPEEQEEQTLRSVEAAELVVDGSGASISWDTPGQAYYSPLCDEIHLPPRSDFESSEGLYGIAFHELVHWTGHSSRALDVHPNHSLEENRRNKSADRQGFGSVPYAFEELVAELGAMMLCSVTGVNQPLEVRDNHIAYLKSWSDAIREEPRALFSAASRAKDAAAYLMNRAGLEVPTLDPSHPYEEKPAKLAA